MKFKSSTQLKTHTMSNITTVICLMNAADGTIAFDRYKNNMPRFINARVSVKAPTIKAFLKDKYNIDAEEYPDHEWSPTPNLRIVFCSVGADDAAGAAAMAENFWCMTIDTLKDTINFEQWGYPLKFKGIQGAMYRFQDYLLPEQARKWPAPGPEPVNDVVQAAATVSVASA